VANEDAGKFTTLGIGNWRSDDRRESELDAGAARCQLQFGVNLAYCDRFYWMKFNSPSAKDWQLYSPESRSYS